MSRVRSGWLAERHSLGAETALVVGLYAVAVAEAELRAQVRSQKSSI